MSRKRGNDMASNVGVALKKTKEENRRKTLAGPGKTDKKGKSK